MKLTQAIFRIVTVSALVLVGQAQSAQAFNAGDFPPTGVTNQGDNHSFNISDPTKVPEPGIMLGLVAIGGSIWAKRKRG